MQELIEELKKREIIQKITNEKALFSLPKGTKIYAGFDPTADSLHLGNYLLISVLKRFKMAGFEVVAVLGGATAAIGDPSFRVAERDEIKPEVLAVNKAKIAQQLASFGFEVFDNLEIYQNMSVLEFLKNIGSKINVNYMIAKEMTATRLENGLTFSEFSYQLLQGYDFVYLYTNKKVLVQLGGSDQWGNITTGLELIKRSKSLEDLTPVGITIKLLTDKNGRKFGKSVSGALWLDPEKTPVFSVYQYLLNQADESVQTLLMWLTALPLQAIQELLKEHARGPKRRSAQKSLAFEVCKNIYGESAAIRVRQISEILFDFQERILELGEAEIQSLEAAIPCFSANNRNYLEILVEEGIVGSKREAKEVVANGGIYFDNQVLKDLSKRVSFENFGGRYVLLRKGKKSYYLVKH